MNIHSRRSRDKPFVTAKRAVSPLSRLGFSLCALVFATPQAASAQGRLDAAIDLYQSATGRSFVERVPVVAEWLADHGYPHMRIGVGETGATDTFGNVSGPSWLNRSLRWAAHHPDEIAAISYFNSTANSDPNVYWPLDESAAKMGVYLKWLSRPAFVARVP